MTPVGQHQAEIQRNFRAWREKPLLQKSYAGFYHRILRLIDAQIPGRIVEVGSGIGNLKSHLPRAICTDLFPNPWLDLVCDGYELPFATGSLSHLVLFDVFHHLRTPKAFLNEARRVLHGGGRLIFFEPYISCISYPIYSFLHHEPVAWRRAIDLSATSTRPRDYYAAQGNATRLLFRREQPQWLSDWKLTHAGAFSAFHYLLSGGYSRPAFYRESWLRGLQVVDHALSRWPKIFGARCLVALTPVTTPTARVDCR